MVSYLAVFVRLVHIAAPRNYTEVLRKCGTYDTGTFETGQVRAGIYLERILTRTVHFAHVPRGHFAHWVLAVSHRFVFLQYKRTRASDDGMQRCFHRRIRDVTVYVFAEQSAKRRLRKLYTLYIGTYAACMSMLTCTNRTLRVRRSAVCTMS